MFSRIILSRGTLAVALAALALVALVQLAQHLGGPIVALTVWFSVPLAIAAELVRLCIAERRGQQ